MEDILLANRTVNYVKETLVVGIGYKSGMITKVCIAAVTDAAHGNGSEYLCYWDAFEVFRSQGAKTLFIFDECLVSQEKNSVHPVVYSSVVKKRVVNSTVMAETSTRGCGRSIGLARSWFSRLAWCTWPSRLGGERSIKVSECLVC